jgi:hypothetical protein
MLIFPQARAKGAKMSLAFCPCFKRNGPTKREKFLISLPCLHRGMNCSNPQASQTIRGGDIVATFRASSTYGSDSTIGNYVTLSRALAVFGVLLE